MALSSRFQDALVLAAQLHADQVRKGTKIPYLSHLLIVAGIALEHGAIEDEAIAALLHDAVEDQGGSRTYELIRERFGQTVADIVAGCSDTDQTPKPPWKERKLDYLKHLRSAAPSVRLVSAADKLHNATAILADYQTEGESLWSRFNGGREGTLWYYRALTDIFATVGPARLANLLDQVVSELERRVRQGEKDMIRSPVR